MKKIMIGAFLVLLCLAGVEIALLHNTGEAVLPELSEKMKEVKFDNPSVVHHYTNISVNGKNYTELSFVIEEGYARENKKTPMIGRCAWMGNEAAKYEKIVIEKGIRIIYAESFRGVKADVVEFPESSLKGREESYGEGANKTHLTYTIA